MNSKVVVWLLFQWWHSSYCRSVILSCYFFSLSLLFSVQFFPSFFCVQIRLRLFKVKERKEREKKRERSHDGELERENLTNTTFIFSYEMGFWLISSPISVWEEKNREDRFFSLSLSIVLLSEWNVFLIGRLMMIFLQLLPPFVEWADVER